MRLMVLILAACATAISGCAAEQAMKRVANSVDGITTKALDKANFTQLLADGQLDATNPEVSGYAEAYQAWGVRWNNRLNGVIARAHIQASGDGTGMSDPELRRIIANKLGDPGLQELDAAVRTWLEIKAGRAATSQPSN